MSRCSRHWSPAACFIVAALLPACLLAPPAAGSPVRGGERTVSATVVGGTADPGRAQAFSPGAGYGWPLNPAPDVVTPFRPPTSVYGPGHRGVDLAGSPGQPVLAARGGTVVFAGPLAGRGVVSVQHGDGLRTTYEPLAPTVTAGTVVRAGGPLGRLEAGHPGCPVAACLHWGVLRNRVEYLDPLVLLRPAHVRLLPVPVPWPASEPT